MVRIRRGERRTFGDDAEFKENPWRRRVFIALGLAMAIVAGVGSYYMSSQAPQQAQAQTPTRIVAVAARELPAQTVIESSMLALREVPDDPFLASAVADVNLLVGRVTGVPILMNQPITPNLLSTAVAGAEFSILSSTDVITADSPEWRAVSIMVPKERAVGGMVEVGQHVDLFVTLQVNVMTVDADGQISNQPDPSHGYYSDRSTKISWENLEVLAKNEDADYYVLKVDLHQAEEINHMAASAGSFSLALRPDGDTRLIDRSGYGETIDRIIEQYGFPLPVLIDIDTYPQPSPLPPPGAPLPTPVPTPTPPATPAPSGSPTPAPSASASASPAASPSP